MASAPIRSEISRFNSSGELYQPESERKIERQCFQPFFQFSGLFGRRVPAWFDGGDRDVSFHVRAHIVRFILRLLRIDARIETRAPRGRFLRSGDSPPG